MGELGGLKSGVDFAIILIGNETTKIALTAPTSSSPSCAIRFICLCDMKFNEILMGGWISATEFIVCTYMKFEIERFRVNVFFSLFAFSKHQKKFRFLVFLLSFFFSTSSSSCCQQLFCRNLHAFSVSQHHRHCQHTGHHFGQIEHFVQSE